MKKYCFQDFIDAAISRGYEVISTEDEYQNSATKLKYICPIHKDKGIQEITLSHLLSGRGCYYCGRERTERAHLKDIDGIITDEMKQLCLDRDYTFDSVIRKRVNGESKIFVNFVCNKHKEFGIQSVPYNNFKRNQKCQYCANKNLPQAYLLAKAKELSPQITVLSEVHRINDRVDCVCEKHNHYFNVRFGNILKQSVCYYCGLEKLAQFHTLTDEEVDSRIHEANPNVERIGEYNGITQDIRVRCNKCGYEWDGRLTTLRYCPNCENDCFYSGEHNVIKLLSNNNIDYTFQKKFDDCKNKRVLRFDFHLPEKNICIEFNGRQHYEPVEFFGGEKSFEQQLENDEIKRQYCIDNNIKLIEIPYHYNTMQKVSNYLLPQLVS